MADVIRGDVTNIVDGDTFDVDVTHYSKTNQISYNDKERIRIAGIEAPEIPSKAGERVKEHLEKNFLGKHVKLTIQAGMYING